MAQQILSWVGGFMMGFSAGGIFILWMKNRRPRKVPQPPGRRPDNPRLVWDENKGRYTYRPEQAS